MTYYTQRIINATYPFCKKGEVNFKSSNIKHLTVTTCVSSLQTKFSIIQNGRSCVQHVWFVQSIPWYDKAMSALQRILFEIQCILLRHAKLNRAFFEVVSYH